MSLIAYLVEGWYTGQERTHHILVHVDLGIINGSWWQKNRHIYGIDICYLSVSVCNFVLLWLTEKDGYNTHWIYSYKQHNKYFYNLLKYVMNLAKYCMSSQVVVTELAVGIDSNLFSPKLVCRFWKSDSKRPMTSFPLPVRWVCPKWDQHSNYCAQEQLQRRLLQGGKKFNVLLVKHRFWCEWLSENILAGSQQQEMQDWEWAAGCLIRLIHLIFKVYGRCLWLVSSEP